MQLAGTRPQPPPLLSTTASTTSTTSTIAFLLLAFLAAPTLSAAAATACDWASQGACHVPLVNPVYQAHSLAIKQQLATSSAAPPRNVTFGRVGHQRRQITINELTGTGDTGGTLFAYHGQLLVGTPAQPFDILFDTGSQQLWVQGRSTLGGVNPQGHFFDSKRSTTFKSTGAAAAPINYVDGTSVTGVLVTDVVSINNLTIPNLTFEVATAVTGSTNSTGGDGIMGMSFSLPGTTATPNLPTFFERLVSSNKVSAPVFGYFIDSTNANGGLTLGGVDSARIKSDFVTLPVAPSGKGSDGKDVFLFWQSVMDFISFEGAPGKLTMTSNFAVVFDTGTSLAVLPAKVADQLNLALGLTKARQSSSASASLYAMDCSNGKIPTDLPNIVFTFSGRNITITPAEYIFFQAGARPGQVACVSGFAGQDIATPSTTTTPPAGSQPLPILPQAIFGNVFLRRFYTVFNVKDHTVALSIADRRTSLSPTLAATAPAAPPGNNRAPGTGSASSSARRGLSSPVTGATAAGGVAAALVAVVATLASAL
ncbi:aspartic peptidase domain-containing protein [Geranomyces variabilis]|nr:aspartic peptidase domain-containing protein [Geranomyces variabilis]KAJ3141648.1 Vacuolar protease A [Geranomyces variabilis]